MSWENKNDNKNPEEFYDIVVDIKSMMNWNSTGFEVSWNDNGLKNYNTLKNKDSCVVGIVGNANCGKTFILSRIVTDELQMGFSVSTKGLSVKYPKNSSTNIVILDTAGFETPWWETLDVEYGDIFKADKTEADEIDIGAEVIKTNEPENTQAEGGEEDDATVEASADNIKASEIEKENEEEEEEVQKDWTKYYKVVRDKQHTEYFIQSFVLQNSNIWLVVIGQLSYQDQKLLNRIKKEHIKKHIFFIHNLFNFLTKKQVEEYIENTLNKSLTFLLNKNTIMSTDAKKDKDDLNTTYFVEENLSEEEKVGSIVHLIMAQEGSEAGNYYNPTTIEYLKKQMYALVQSDKFPVISKVKKHLATLSSVLLESKFDEKDVLFEGNKNIKVNKDKLTLKMCKMDELGFNTFQSRFFSPDYRIYWDEKDQSLLIIEINVCGDISNIRSAIEKEEPNYNITIRGTKTLKFANKNYFSNRDKGTFSLSIEIPSDGIYFEEYKPKKCEMSKGYLRLFYQLKGKDKSPSGEEY